MDLKRWKLFKDLDSSLISMCKIAEIIDYPKVGFLVLRNEDVYAVTDTADNFKWLGNGISYTGAVAYQASKVEALCGKGITNFYGNERSFAALTEVGSVYSWTSDKDSYPNADGIPRKVSFPDPKEIQASQVSYGVYHTLCLTSERETCGWGDDDKGQLGSGSKRGYGCDVTKIVGFNGRIDQVVAGNETSYALDSLGKVWSWGSCQNFSLGYEASNFQLTPKVIENLPEIKKIAAGDSHVLALSKKGELYFWGKFERFADNDEFIDDHHGEVTIKPLLIQMSKEGVEPVVDIASMFNANYAVCRSKEKVYLWGIWFQQHIKTPLATKFSSIEEVFACAESPIMLQPIHMTAYPQIVVADAWKRAFNDHSTADVLFSVENEVLHAHKTFLKFRSDYFRRMFENEWEESKRGSGVIKIQGFSFGTFKSFMYFLYNCSLMELDMPVEGLTELMRAADYYGDDDLRFACEDKLKHQLTSQNACFVYACAVKSNAENLQNHAVKFMIPVYREVVNSEECDKMDSDLKTKLMIRFADFNMFQVSKEEEFCKI